MWIYWVGEYWDWFCRCYGVLGNGVLGIKVRWWGLDIGRFGGLWYDCCDNMLGWIWF